MRDTKGMNGRFTCDLSFLTLHQSRYEDRERRRKSKTDGERQEMREAKERTSVMSAGSESVPAMRSEQPVRINTDHVTVNYSGRIHIGTEMEI